VPTRSTTRPNSVDMEFDVGPMLDVRVNYYAPARRSGRLQIGARRFPADRGGLLDAPQRPSQSPQRQYLLLFVVVQDVAHGGDGTCVPGRRQRLGCYVWWPVFRCPLVAGFECSPRLERRRVPPARTYAAGRSSRAPRSGVHMAWSRMCRPVGQTLPKAAWVSDEFGAKLRVANRPTDGGQKSRL
jgi:hypothetical protein